jgi:dTDP-L-rhamnose 4-epimerase
MMKTLVTGGAGFIGSHLVDRLVKEGHEVSILDNLSGNDFDVPDYLNREAKFIEGDVRDNYLLGNIIHNYDAVFHYAASVGIAQSNYEIINFVENNSFGTAVLLENIINAKTKPKLIIAASNTTYGEGIYECEEGCGFYHPAIRSEDDIKKHGFEPLCPECGKPGFPTETPETTELNCNSIYAFTKRCQEDMALLTGRMYDFPVVALKYFNVFGTRQSLSNPYTGVSAIFMNRAKNGNPLMIYEDGMQTRDFVYIDDVVEANILALQNNNASGEVFNIGSGNGVRISSLASEICRLYKKDRIYKKDFGIEITNVFRKGDIRHCIADNSKAKKVLGWKPRIKFGDGLRMVYEWAKTQKSEDNFDRADKELRDKGLV